MIEKTFYVLATIGLMFYIADKVAEWTMAIISIIKAFKDR